MKLLRVPVFFFLETVLGNEKSAGAGELRRSGHGATAPGLAPWWPAAAEVPCWFLSRPIKIQGPKTDRTPSLHFLSKSP